MFFIRKATHAGEWYPTDDQLKIMLEASFHYAQPKPNADLGLKGVISPHSCYQVCLRTAAYSFSCINPDKFERIIILGTCHHIALKAGLVSHATEVETPFGNLQVDTEVTEKLATEYGEAIQWMDQKVDENEHSLEMQYPLIKYIWQDRPVKIIPMLIGSLSEPREIEIAEALSPIITDEKTFFIISSDFTHWGEIFHHTPIQSTKKKQLSQQLQIADERSIGIIHQFNYEHFRFICEEIHGSICGCYSICLMLRILAEGYEFEVFDRSELCELRTMKDFSISYVAAGFYDKSQRPAPEKAPEEDSQGMMM